MDEGYKVGLNWAHGQDEVELEIEPDLIRGNVF